MCLADLPRLALFRHVTSNIAGPRRRRVALVLCNSTDACYSGRHNTGRPLSDYFVRCRSSEVF